MTTINFGIEDVPPLVIDEEEVYVSFSKPENDPHTFAYGLNMRSGIAPTEILIYFGSMDTGRRICYYRDKIITEAGKIVTAVFVWRKTDSGHQKSEHKPEKRW